MSASSRPPDELFEDIPDDLLVASLPDPELLALFRNLGLRSSMSVPLVARDRVLGTLTLVLAESGRRYRKDDLLFAEEFARRIVEAALLAMRAEKDAALARLRELEAAVGTLLTVAAIRRGASARSSGERLRRAPRAR